MKSKALHWVLLLFLAACRHENEGLPEKSPNYYENLNVRAWQKEVLPIDSVRISGQFPILTTRYSLINFLGKPDKIFASNILVNSNLDLVRGHNENSEYLVFGNTVFEVKNDKAILHSFSFDNDNTWISIPGLVLNNRTRPKDVQTIYPESGRLLIGNMGNIWSGYMMVNEGPPYSIHKLWVFTFELEKLKTLKLTNYSPFVP